MMSKNSPSQPVNRVHTDIHTLRNIYNRGKNQTEISSGNTLAESFPFLQKDSGHSAPFGIEAKRGHQQHKEFRHGNLNTQ